MNNMNRFFRDNMDYFVYGIYTGRKKRSQGIPQTACITLFITLSEATTLSGCDGKERSRRVNNNNSSSEFGL